MIKWIQKHNIQYWVLSFFIALALWIYVTVMLDPEISNTVSGIPVVYTGGDILDSADLTMLGGQETISVTFEGRRTDLNALTNKTLTAVASLSDVKQTGEYKLFYDLDGPGELRSVKVAGAPNYVIVHAEKMIPKEVPVRLSLNAGVAEGYISDKEQINPQSIVLRGPESIISGIEAVFAEYSQSEPLTRSYEKVLDYAYVNAYGAVVEKTPLITASTNKVNLSQRILMLKEIPLRLSTVDGGGLTRDNCDFRIVPSTISVAGDAEVLENLNAINIQTLDLARLVDSVTLTGINIDAELPDGVRNVSGISEATATVNIVGAKKRVMAVPAENFELSNSHVPEGYMLRFMTTLLTVTIRGPEAAVNQVEVHNISVMIDMPEGELVPQTYSRSAKATVNGFPDVGVIELDYLVSIAVVPIPAAEGNEDRIA